MRQVIATQWYRIDKSDGSLLAVNQLAVARAAMGSFDNASEVIKAGRFVTAFAIYSQGQYLTEMERS
jgi:hypothetical protein